MLLVDPMTLDTRYQQQTNLGGNFAFAMSNVAPGEYLLVAGTDRNNDDVLGDAGELFGAYPSLDTPQIVTIVAGQNVGNLDFSLQELATVQTLGGSASSPRTFRRLR